jgi:Fe2+ or Zn2+ uptake regulation protein
MKDAMLAAKDEQLRNLQLKLTEQSEELVKVLKEKEDLETLTQSL